jgi:hypothetical protein
MTLQQSKGVVMMVVLKINNLIQPNGLADYKGLDIDKFVEPPLYPHDENVCYAIYDGTLVNHEDVIVIDLDTYNAVKEHIEKTRPKSPEEQILERIELMQQALDDLLLGGM